MEATGATTPRFTIVETAGLVLPDGSIIELVGDRAQPYGVSLLHWNRDSHTIRSMILHRETAYVPIRLQPSVRRALRLPFGCSPSNNLAEVIGELSSCGHRFLGLSGSTMELLAGGVLATWRPEVFSVPFNLAVWCPRAAEAAQLLRWLHCVCRRPLPLTNISGGDLVNFSDGLDPTLLLFRPSLTPRMRETLANYGWRGIYTARGRRLVGSTGAKIVVTVDEPLDTSKIGRTLEIVVPPSRDKLEVLDESSETEIAQNFQPAFLRYRLSLLGTPVSEGSQAPAPSGGVNPFVTGFASCFATDPELRKRQISLLVEAEKSVTTGSVDINQPLVEVLLARCHEPGRQAIHVAEILIDLKAILDAYGEESDASERFVGALLKALGFRTKPLDREGRGLKLDGKNRRRIHELARGYRLRSAEQPFPGCVECVKTQIAET